MFVGNIRCVSRFRARKRKKAALPTVFVRHDIYTNGDGFRTLSAHEIGSKCIEAVQRIFLIPSRE